MLACTALVGCTNSDEPEVDNKVLSDEYCMAVKFAMSGETTGRALTNEYQNGGETKVVGAMFYFLDAKGASVSEPYYLSGDINLTSSSHHTTDESQTNPIIVMKNPTAIPSSIVAILNPPTELANDKNKRDLNYLQNIEGNYDEITTNIIMSNSVYQDANGKEVIGAPVSSKNIATSKEELQLGINNGAKSPVEIHVERVLAKVNVTNNSTIDNSTVSPNETLVSTSNPNGAKAEFKVKIMGWWLADTYSKSYLLKDMATAPTNWLEPNYQWNDITNLRSYWANPVTGGTWENKAWNQYSTDDKYCHENTSTSNPTQVVVAARIYTGTYDANNLTTYIKWREDIYTEEYFKIAIANLEDVRQFYKVTSGVANGENVTYESIGVAELDFAFNTNEGDVTVGSTAIKDHEAVVTLKGTTVTDAEGKKTTTYPEVYTLSKDAEGKTVATKVDTDDVNEALNGIATVKMWKDGDTYYYVNIEHDANGKTDDEFRANPAVIRNHLYKLTLNSASGLGTPVPNPDKVIETEKVTDEDVYSYISAQIYVLKYRVVSQGVDLKSE